MRRNDTHIHHVEILLTLDYLLNYTDANHPATQQDICRHALNFGLKYDSKANTGNDVRRQRIGECLQFLQSICYKYEESNKIPFTINTTNGGKFYLEKKNDLSEEQIIKILSAIKNDKYTRDEDTDYLIEKLLDVLSNKCNREYFKEELNTAIKNVKKYNFTTNRKLRLVYKAFNEGKLIKIRFNAFSKYRKPADAWYRVYKIKEYDNKPYGILLLVGNDKEFHINGMLFDAIENLNIPNLKDNECLCEDMEDNRDLDELFAAKNKVLYKYYGNVENFLKANIRPQGLFAFRISFYFSLKNEDLIKQSFEDFFSIPLEYAKCSTFERIEEQSYGKTMSLPRKNDQGTLKPNHLKDNEKPKYGVCNILLNSNAFRVWVLSSCDIDRNISDVIHIVSPSFINEDIANYYYEHLIKHMDNLRDKDKENLLFHLKKDQNKYETDEHRNI